MAKKMTDAEKAEAAEKRAALRVAAKAEADAKLAAEAEAKAEEEAKAKADADAEAEAKANVDADAEAKVKADAEAEVKANAEAEIEGNVASIKTKRGVKSRWRAGYQFGPEAREIPLDDLSEEQLEALAADPSLVVDLGE